MLVKTYPDRQTTSPTEDKPARVAFDESLLPEDIWERNLDECEFEVDRIADVRTGRRPRYSAPYVNIW